MNWYYVHAGKQMGPVDELQLADLHRNAKIQNETLIWREGMENWLPYTEAGPRNSPSAGDPPPLGTSTTGAPTSETTHITKEAVCTACGKIFAITAMTQFGDSRICAACKPAYAAKLAERARAGQAGFHYAGFWTRFAAVFLDSIILKVGLVPVAMVMGQSFGQAIGTSMPTLDGTLIGLAALQIVILFAYETLFVGKYGATPGKMACKIKVITASGLPLSYGRAAGRSIAKVLSCALCMIGYLIAGFDSEKRALHDRLCDTRVIFTSPL